MEFQEQLLVSIKSIVHEARTRVYKQTNTILLQMYWDIGRLIIEDEQGGAKRAEYGKAVLKHLAEELTREFGKGFEYTNLTNMRNFYRAFPKFDAVRQELSWTHYRILSRVEKEATRQAYMRECAQSGWNTRILQRNIDSNYLGRLLKVPESASETPNPKEFIKDPYIFEFLGLPHHDFSENNLEAALIQNLQTFLMELGKGYAFVARQQRISTETSDFFIDLVFYNYILKCFVLIDLKTDKLSHQDIGQMDMYVRLYNDIKKADDDNPTIGIILCTDSDETIVKYSVLAENERLFAGKYRLYLPSEEELKHLIAEQQTVFQLKQKNKKE